MILDLNQARMELAFSALYMFNKKFFMKYQEKSIIRISFDFHGSLMWIWDVIKIEGTS